MHTEKSYEIIRFLKHDGEFRVVMDCKNGSLLIDRLREGKVIEKNSIFLWFRALAEELEKYHICKKGQCYRFVNPYSVLVTQAEEIYLLDLSAEENRFVTDKMQSPAMRQHFVKPVVRITEASGQMPDFYGFGKTIQFILAYTEPFITLSKKEIYLLSAVVRNCLGENPKKKYEAMKQVKKELPGVNPRIQIIEKIQLMGKRV